MAEDDMTALLAIDFVPEPAHRAGAGAADSVEASPPDDLGP